MENIRHDKAQRALKRAKWLKKEKN